MMLTATSSPRIDEKPRKTPRITQVAPRPSLTIAATTSQRSPLDLRPSEHG